MVYLRTKHFKSVELFKHDCVINIFINFNISIVISSKFLSIGGKTILEIKYFPTVSITPIQLM